MTPAARLAAAVDILAALDPDRPVEPQLKAWSRANRYAGSKDRRAIADRVYTVLRRRRTCAAQGGGGAARALVLGSLVQADGASVGEIEALCRGGYGLAPLDDAERTALGRSPDWESEAERLDWPDWLWEEALEAFGPQTARELDALRQRAPLDLRVNTLKATAPEARQALEEDGAIARADIVEVPDLPSALRLPSGFPVLANRAWREGLVELQDAGSQAVAAMTAARPGETVLDFCAGAGGKTLALAATMRNEGHLFAYDVAPVRMADLPERAERAGATCITVVESEDLPAFEGKVDRVLVDAPCSGSGSWRRDPAGKWRLTPERLADLTEMQDDALDAAARFVRPGGTLLYATCSILRSEDEERVAAFLHRHDRFTLDETRRLHPARDGCDGFFAARMTLTGC